MIIITIFLILIFMQILALMIALSLAWRRISIYLTWNTRYQTADYEQAVVGAKPRKPAEKASKTEQRGRAIVPVDDLVDLADLDFETAYKAIDEAGA